MIWRIRKSYNFIKQLNLGFTLSKSLLIISYLTFYYQVDVWNWKFLFLPLQWIGMNAMLVYVMAAGGIFAGFINGWYYENPHNTLVLLHLMPSVFYTSHGFLLLVVLWSSLNLDECIYICPQVNWIQKHIFIEVWHSRRVGILLYVIFAEICFWAIVAGIFHWFGIYWKL